MFSWTDEKICPYPTAIPNTLCNGCTPLQCEVHFICLQLVNHTEQEELTKQENNILAYIAGYIVRKIGKKCCQPCNETCNEKVGAPVDDDNPNHELIQEKSYGKLQAPSQSLLGLVQLLELRYRKVITNIISKENVKSHLSHELSKVVQLQHFKCDHCHPHLLIVHIMINIRLYHSIREINNGLKDNKSRKNRKTIKVQPSLKCRKTVQ